MLIENSKSKPNIASKSCQVIHLRQTPYNSYSILILHTESSLPHYMVTHSCLRLTTIHCNISTGYYEFK